MSVEFLLARGADISAKNDDGKTAADLAKSKGREDLARTIESFVPGDVDVPGSGASPGGGGGGFATDVREEEVD